MDLTVKKSSTIKLVTGRAPVNIAVIKYWGKRNESLILPLNSSVSATLSMDQMSAKTSIAISKDFQEDRIWLNGREEKISNPRIQKCLEEFRKLLLEREGSPELSWKIHICSENDFPTAAGLASSAAGYACLVYTLGLLLGFQDVDLSSIARQGSGSACRSLKGGFVQWEAGKRDDGRDSVAWQIEPEDHWPEIRILVLVVSDSQKETSSTGGMQRSVETSSMLNYRCQNIVPDRINEMHQAIRGKDFNKFSELTMKDSNQFHAICQDTYPPIRYMNDTSWAVVDLIHQYNQFRGTNRVAYTFDAGPNACLYLLEQDVPEVLSLVAARFPTSDSITHEQFCVGLPVLWKEASPNLLSSVHFEPTKGSIKYVIHTKVGKGPEEIQDHLLNDCGFPRKLSK